MLFLCYPRCSTCKKAQNWLDAHGITYELRNIKEDHPSRDELYAWHVASGLPLRKLFNTSGQLYRSLELAKRLPSLSEDEQLDLLASDGMLVKRPLLIRNDAAPLIGFREADWQTALLG